jgi:hypothetical protein
MATANGTPPAAGPTEQAALVAMVVRAWHSRGVTTGQQDRDERAARIAVAAVLAAQATPAGGA